MASRQATNRLRKELKAIGQEPPPHIHVYCDDSNILIWNYLLEGPPDTPYDGGWYWGRLKCPKDYPFAPPSITMVTPNGRFETNVRLCLSMSDYHPETWQPAWSLSSVLKGLLSFMCEDSPTAGAINPIPSPEERRRLAQRSLNWNKANADFMKLFPEVDKLVAEAAAQRQPAEKKEETPVVEAVVEAVIAQSGYPTDTPPAAPVAAIAAIASEFIVGSRVRILDLPDRTDLNDREGVIDSLGEIDEVATALGIPNDEFRINVKIGEEEISVKVEHLALVR